LIKENAMIRRTKLVACLAAAGLSMLMIMQCSDFPTEPDPGSPDPYLHHSGQFAISSPRAGARLRVDTVCTITWTSIRSQYSLVSIYLCQDTTVITSIASGTSNDGSYSWTVRGASGSNYRIKIASYYDSDTCDYSPAFSIYSQYYGAITVTSPKADTSWSRGSTYYIRWDTTGYVGNQVNIALYRDTTYVSSIASVSNSRSYLWYISSSMTGGTDYRIKVTSTGDAGIYGFSDTFTIATGYTGSINITSPSSTTTWTAGNTCTMTWTTTGSTGGSVTIELYRGATRVQAITTGSYDDGSNSWTVPSSIQSGNDYRLKVSAYYDASIYDYSDTFAIAGLVVDKYEYDDIRDSATAFDSLGATQARSLVSGDYDWVSFQADSGATYSIETWGTAVTYVYLYRGSSSSYLEYGSGSTSTRRTSLWYACT
jgi:hypothetical protein